jgi:hypothetical protein
MMWKEAVVACFKLISQQLTGGNKKDQEDPAIKAVEH